MNFRHISPAILTIALGIIACSFGFPQSAASPTAHTSAPPTFTATSSNIPVLTPGASSMLLDEINLVELYRQCNPGIVAIWTFSDLGAAYEDVPSGQGSGFVLDRDGHIITNQHVIMDVNEIEVDFPSGYRAWAEVVGTDPDSDLAVLHVDVPAEQLHPLPLGDSNEINVGDFVVAIGNPFGLSGTMTVGIVSAIGRTLASERNAPSGGAFTAGAIIQTDAAINPGNSGGPLLNMRGEVIGINRAIRTESFTLSGDAANSGVGFAIPVNILRRVAPSLIEKGSYDYPYLGITSLSADTITLKLLEALGLPSDARGAYVTCVTPGGPADRAGIIGASNCEDSGYTPGGDWIVAINGIRINDFNDLLTYLILETEPGVEVTLTILRNGEEVEVPLMIGARP
jgi:S1-C subfamily serine protease